MLAGDDSSSANVGLGPSCAYFQKHRDCPMFSFVNSTVIIAFSVPSTLLATAQNRFEALGDCP
ncbi:hypothetical protein BDM02DRAFT_3193606 [Thelephora ganbajun]|uniref:Uncharacterized protein n=1 Tax=Thelephora ganbajun TaxID=370292 RepID=A0ACB6YXY1_THEGA|nr:hypothetical protein BDM02DRAFT_3193606 [Thelephora ganbajun]